METKINIAEILKNCPKGTKLYSPIFGMVYFESVKDTGHATLIEVSTSCNSIQQFYPDGKYNTYYSDSECLLFPSKENRDWDTFQVPFKDGDIVSTKSGVWIGIVKRKVGNAYETYITIYAGKAVYSNNIFCFEKLATEEEKQKLFDAIKTNGYKWNAETKTLEKLIVPKFKVGDRIKRNKANVIHTIKAIENQLYVFDDLRTIMIAHQDDYELVPNKFDITTLKSFDSEVLVREGKTDVWQPTFYGFFNQHNKRFYTTSTTWRMCIPYNEDTKHLTGTTNDCDGYYKIWE